MSRTKLKAVLDSLEAIAPLRLAEEWDNVGLLVEAKRNATVKSVLFTIDLTRPVFDESVLLGADLIVSYHPPIFSGLKRLSRRNSQQEIILDAVRKGIAIYSPHTALDACEGGVNDWLISGLGIKNVTAISQANQFTNGMDTKLVVFVPDTHVDELRRALVEAGCGRIGKYSHCSFELEGQGTFQGDASTNPLLGKAGNLERVDEIRLEMVCRQSDLGQIGKAIKTHHPYEEAAWDALAMRTKVRVKTGQGRQGKLNRPLSLHTAIKKVKQHLGLSYLRVASAPRHQDGERLESVAVCAGAGASVLLGQSADLLVTGEMRHHDVLACVAKGQSVILCEHTNTERGFLPILAKQILNRHSDLEVQVSKTDRDPLVIQ
ncbi:MAG: dinuclear metal center YbgI/SA1388 family protein [Planctomycetota bacterium]|jgi:dinuclear metal center YbgI/SA1388 family protein